MIPQEPPRTRGLLYSSDQLCSLPQGDLSIAALLDHIRDHVHGLPLTIAIHGWGSTATARVIDLVAQIRNPDDALWVILERAPAEGSPEDREDVVLLLRDHVADRDTYEHLVFDVAFFSGDDPAELETISTLAGHCGPVLIHDGGPNTADLQHIASVHELAASFWSTSGVLSEPYAGTIVTLFKRDLAAVAVDRVGWLLTQHVGYLRKHNDRRLQFRTLVREVVDSFPDVANMKQRLVDQAAVHGWPSWAIDGIGAFYLVTNAGDSDNVTAYVWRHVYTCIGAIPGVEVLETLCGGDILQVRIPLAVVPQVERVAATFRREVGEFEYPNDDRSFAGAINNALNEVGGIVADAAVAAHIAEARISLLRDAELPVPP